MPVDVVIPWRGGDSHREAALTWVLDRYEQCGMRVLVSEAGPGPWIKANAVMPAIAAVSTEIVVVADADVWCDDLKVAIGAVESGCPWTRPHSQVRRLTQESTALILAGAAPDLTLELAQRPYSGVWGGGIVVARREQLLQVPLDPRFEGWGGEDMSWGLALNELAGAGWCGPSPLYHLWHPPQERMTRKHGSEASRQLWRRYVQARRDPKLMRALIEEAHVALSTDQSTVPDRSAL